MLLDILLLLLLTLKISGNKKELIKRVWNYLRYSKYASIIQKIWRGFIIRESLSTSKIKNCVNSTDFLLLDELSNISPQQVFCFKDEDGFTYGFHVKSFHNLILKNKEPATSKPLKLKSDKNIDGL